MSLKSSLQLIEQSATRKRAESIVIASKGTTETETKTATVTTSTIIDAVEGTTIERAAIESADILTKITTIATDIKNHADGMTMAIAATTHPTRLPALAKETSAMLG